MRRIPFDFYDDGTTIVNGQSLPWRYRHRVGLILYESTETWGADMLGKDARHSLHDIKRILRHKFQMGAIAESRRKYVETIGTGEKISA
jgi:hypothetical protein